MKRLFQLAIVVIALSMAAPSASYAQKKRTTRTTTTTKKELTPEERLSAFYKKWGTKFSQWCDGQANYGWPKQFFTDMLAAMPDRFQWEKSGTENGYVAYQFVFKRSDNPYSEATLEGTLVFQGSKLYAVDISAFG